MNIEDNVNNEINLEELIEKKVVIKNGNWYNYINGEEKIKLGLGKEEATKALKDLFANKNETNEKNKNTSENNDLQPVNNINPNLNNEYDDEMKIMEDLYAPLASDVGDITSRGKGGRFRIFVFGIDSRLKEHPIIQKCLYEFRHCDMKKNVKSGQKIDNQGWTVVSKDKIGTDPRNGKKWLTVARDDSPGEDYYQV